MWLYAGLCGPMRAYAGQCGPMWAYAGLCGCMWAGLCGSMWAYAGLCCSMWAYVGLCGPMQAYAGLSGSMWAYVGLCGPMWVYVGGLCGWLYPSINIFILLQLITEIVGVRGGIPGRRQDYPMFDPTTGRRMHVNETLESPRDFELHQYVGLYGYCELAPSLRARHRLQRRALVCWPLKTLSASCVSRAKLAVILCRSYQHRRTRRGREQNAALA